MAKKNRRGNSIPQQNSSNGTNPGNATSATAVLMQRLPAALQTAGQVHGNTDLAKELTIDSQFLDGLLAVLPGDCPTQLRSWLDKFTGFIKELGKKSEGLEAERKQLEEDIRNEKARLEAESKELEDKRAAVASSRQEIDKSLASIEPQLEALKERVAEATAREKKLELREMDARRGFATLREQDLAGLKSDIQALEAERDRLVMEVGQQMDALNASQRQKDLELAKRERDLEQREHQINSMEIYIAGVEASLENKWKEVRSAIDAGIELERENFVQEAKRLKESKQRASDTINELNAKLAEYEDLAEMLDDRSPQDLLDEMETLSKTCRDLKARFAGTDADQMERDNRSLRTQIAGLQSDLLTLREQLAENQEELHMRRMAATDLANLRSEKIALEKGNTLLGARLNDLSSQINQIKNEREAKSAFPALSGMDKDERYLKLPVLEHVPSDLKAFADELQHRIALAEPNTTLYYPIHEIRTLLGGLAMSQLHVLQGISGTGKTSLAKAFAKAMGGECTDIAVQAGWRDRDDLLGYYNAFEKRFYEKPCLQALYKAQTPAWNDCCNVILLDEMNLSRPEQYFSEFLSVLEKNNKRERTITLHESAMADAPALFVEQCMINLPENVWFIGTANHDETTNELADKTYDRAHVMTLPRQDQKFKIKQYEPAKFSFSSLQQQFNRAVEKYGPEAEELLKVLQKSQLPTVLEEYFELGWGNRLDRQGMRFIPVMIAAGATGASALDHLLSTRVLRKGRVIGRHDKGPQELSLVEDALVDLAKIIGQEDLKNSLELIDKDRNRLERGL